MLAVTEQGRGDVRVWGWFKHHVFKVPLLGPSIGLGSHNQGCRYHVASSHGSTMFGDVRSIAERPLLFPSRR